MVLGVVGCVALVAIGAALVAKRRQKASASSAEKKDGTGVPITKPSITSPRPTFDNNPETHMLPPAPSQSRPTVVTLDINIPAAHSQPSIVTVPAAALPALASMERTSTATTITANDNNRPASVTSLHSASTIVPNLDDSSPSPVTFQTIRRGFGGEVSFREREEQVLAFHTAEQTKKGMTENLDEKSFNPTKVALDYVGIKNATLDKATSTSKATNPHTSPHEKVAIPNDRGESTSKKDQRRNSTAKITIPTPVGIFQGQNAIYSAELRSPPIRLAGGDGQSSAAKRADSRASNSTIVPPFTTERVSVQGSENLPRYTPTWD
ncbi:hypothetical protein HDU67_008398 [Dinochytrium kinnereticum]|nr:hypothetical protein HDU67_008398 [Dinochytrium kinnereticum]